ncbi:MAG: hypothetical protein ABFC63_05255 [Thermoguttaceae bacterium]
MLHVAACGLQCAIVVGLLAAGLPRAAVAAEQPLHFLHLLQKNGYGDMAVEYLDSLAKRGNMPAEIRDVFDLEMSKSLRVAASDAFDAKDQARLMQQSEHYLGKFIREKPDNPATAAATVAWGESLGRQAVERIHAVKGKEKRQQEKVLAEARSQLTEAKEKFGRAARIFKARLDAIPAESKSAANERKQLRTDLEGARYQVAMADYYLAQTYPDLESPERTAALRQAADALEAIFQRDRAADPRLTDVGLLAHLWTGKAIEELGDLDLANEYYEEVLVNPRNAGEKGPATGWEPWFAQVEYFRLAVLAKRKPDEFLREAPVWLQSFRRLSKTDGYQGVALELAKALHVRSKVASGSEKSKRTSEAIQTLIEMSKVRSQHQQEAILLKREILKAAGKSDIEITTFDEAVALGDAALGAEQWESARDAFQQALAIAGRTKLKNAARLDAVREAEAGASLMIARGLFEQNKLGECIELTAKIIFEDADRKQVRKQSPSAAQASALAVRAALNLYRDAPADKRPAALERLMNLAKFTESHWPDLPEADDARMARGHAQVIVEDYRQAIDIFERVNPKSDRFPMAMYLAAQNYVRLYVLEKAKPADQRDAKQMAADYAKAIERLHAGLAELKKQFEPGRVAPNYFVETQLLLAQLHMDHEQFREAVVLYQPLVDIVRAEKPKEFDATTIAVFLGAVRCYCALGQLDKAGEVGAVLVEVGPDSQQVNTALVMFSRLLDRERQRAAALVTELDNAGKAAECERARAKLASTEKLLGAMLAKLAGRKRVSLEGMVFLADGLNTLGMTADATRQYEKILQMAESEPTMAKRAGRAVTRVRSQLAGLLRKQGKYEESLALVNQLIQDNPNSLEPLMEKGRILDDWSELAPEHFDDAVGHWSMLCGRLQPLRRKLPEYYDVTYNVAATLVRQAEKSEDKQLIADRARKAEQVLKSALILNPTLNGPDAVERYQTLLKKAISMQGRSPDKDGQKP